MKYVFILIFIFVILFSCSKTKKATDPQVLMDADIAFSDYSVKYGLQKAFVEFAHDSVVILKDKHMPLVGKQSLIRSYEGKSDSGVSLTWKPAKANISDSGELGYTYGFWLFVAKGDTSQGTYLTIWKKDINNQWKYIADTGNEGLGSQK